MGIDAATTPERASISSRSPGSAQTQSTSSPARCDHPGTKPAHSNAPQPMGIRSPLPNPFPNPVRQPTAQSYPGPERYPWIIRHPSTDNRRVQIQRPPFSRPQHAVFLYLSRDLSGDVLLPKLGDGRNLFVRSTADYTDRGWGPGVGIYQDVRAAVRKADELHSSTLISRDRGPRRLP
jgi:hypothetical protein